MPKKTFFNLEKKKREKFLKASFDEFSAHDYNSASVSLIVRELEIAKGSVYQYFENKEDLFYYLIDLALEEKEKYVGEVKPEKYKNVFNWVAARIEAKFAFDKEKALYSKFLHNFYLQRNNPDIRDKYLKVRHKEYSTIVSNLQKPGADLRKKQDAEKGAFMLLELEQLIPEFPEMDAGKKLSARAQKNYGPQEEMASAFIEILKKGLVKGKK